MWSEPPVSGKMKIVGRRVGFRSSWDDFDALMRTAAALRRTDCLVPRGVYRFASHEEADLWMRRTTARTHARRSPRISRESAGR